MEFTLQQKKFINDFVNEINNFDCNDSYKRQLDK